MAMIGYIYNLFNNVMHPNWDLVFVWYVDFNGCWLFPCTLFLLVPVEFVCEPNACCSWESTISQSEGDRFVDRMICLSFFGAPLFVALFGGKRIEVVSGKKTAGIVLSDATSCCNRRP